MFDWIQQHQTLMEVLGIASVLMFFGSLLLLPVLIAMLPHD